MSATVGRILPATLLDKIIEQVPMRVFWKDRDSRFVGCNSRFALDAGFPHPRDVIGKTDFELGWRDQAALYRADDQRVMETGAPRLVYEEPQTTPDGRTIWLRTSKVPLRDDTGAVVGVLGVYDDVTELRRTRDQLDDSEARRGRSAEFLGTLVAGAVEGVSVCCECEEFPFVKFSVWNDRMTEITGYTMAEINRLGWYQSMYPDPDLQGRAVARMARMRQGDDIVAEEWEITRKSGQKRTLVISTSLVRLENGQPAVIGLMQDITDRKLAEAERRASEHKYRDLFDGSLAAIVVFDQGRRIVDVNQAFCDMLGYPREQLLDRHLAELDVDPDAMRPVQAYLLQGGEVAQFEHQLRRRDGQVLTVYDRSRSQRDARGVVIGVQATLFDVTELRRAQQERESLIEQLAASRRLDSIGRLAGGVAHDFNNLLGVVLGRTRFALELLPQGHPGRPELEESLAAAERSAALTRQLLTFARRQAATPTALELDEAIAQTLQMLGRLIGEDIRIVWRPGGHLPTVTLDPAQLDQVLTNLCVNARDAIDGVGSIEIATERTRLQPGEGPPELAPGDYVCLTFRDDGAGMDEAVRQRVFEPFFTTKSFGSGTGLGLATVHGIVTQNRGHIEVESARGAGTTFRIWLPAGESPAPVAVSPDATPRGGEETILLVEDEPALLRLSQQMLKRLGYHVVASLSPSDALRAAAEHPGRIDLLLTDVVMPQMHGTTLARHVQAAHPEVRVLFTSGYTAEAVARRGADGPHFLPKPFHLDGLARAVRAALEGPAFVPQPPGAPDGGALDGDGGPRYIPSRTFLRK